MDVSNPSNTKKLLKEHNLQLKKSLGQNFLVDSNILDKIVSSADLSEDDTVIEIGPGIGALTQKLAEVTKQVIAVEVDQRLEPVLDHTLEEYNNAEVVFDDALEIDFDQLVDEKYKIVANLPYYITTPIVMRLLEEKFNLDKIVFMVQKEVAERMVASPGGKDYGVLSIGIQYYTNAEILFNVSSNVFIPQPKVSSAVVCLDVLDEPKVEVESEEFYFKIVNAGFQQRRKTIRNSLSKAANINLSRDLVDQALKEVEIDSRRRAEKLSIKQFAQLSNKIFNLYNN